MWNKGSSVTTVVPVKRTFYSRCWLYVAACVLTVLAGHLDLAMQSHLRTVGAITQQALRLSLLEALDDWAGNVYEHEAEHEEQVAHQLEDEAKQYQERERIDQWYADRFAQRAAYLAKLAHLEQAEADEMLRKVSQSDRERLAVLADLIDDEQEEKHLVAQLKTLRQGPCQFTLLTHVCDVVGGATSLQHRADDEYVRIHDEMHDVDELQHQEYLEKLAYKMLQQKANAYNTTAAQLQHVADLYTARVQQDESVANRDRRNATLLEHLAQVHANRSRADWQQGRRVDGLVQQMLAVAEANHKRARHAAAWALLYAILALCYWLYTVPPKVLSWWRGSLEWAAAPSTSSRQFWGTLSCVLQHLLILAFCIGISGYRIIHFDGLDVRQRAVVVFWLAWSGATVQSLALHAVPHVLHEWPLVDAVQGKIIVLCWCKRLLALLGLFLLESLFARVAFRDILFTETAVRVFSHWLWRLLTLASVAWHVALFKPHDMMSSSSGHDEETACMIMSTDRQSASHDDGVSEVSALTGGSFQTGTSPTEGITRIDLSRYAGDYAESSALVARLNAQSPFYVSLSAEYRKLVLPLELLLVSCVLAVLHSCLPIFGLHRALFGHVMKWSLLVAFVALLIKGYQQVTTYQSNQHKFKHSYELVRI